MSLWALVEKATGEVVGANGFHFTAEGPQLELAYHFKRSHWGHNFATEAARACVLYAEIGLLTGNNASRRVLQKVGFCYERAERVGEVNEEWFSISLSLQ